MAKTTGGAHVTFTCIFCGDQLRLSPHSTATCRCGEIEIYNGAILAQGVLRAPEA